MASPRPPIEESEGGTVRGRVMLPPSLTATSSDPSRSAHATSTRAPGNGLACMIALVSSSLTTTVASPIAVATTPDSRRYVPICERAATTLAGACGSSTTLDALTSRERPAPSRTQYDREMPRQPIPKPAALRYRQPLWEPQRHCGEAPAIPVAWGGSAAGTGTGPMTWLDEVT